jgi:AcrR family transcriptional regulator
MRHGPVSPEQAREMQRKRILDAMVAEVGERGLRNVTIAGVSARAGVSRTTFYELFDDLDACVLAVLRQVATRSTALMAKAFAAEASWQDGVLAALAVVPGDVPNACNGWAVAEGAVGALLVVVADPVWQRCAAGVA